ncbi:DUF5034 domain-containing protein [Niabella drilacis]|uniref:Uncharacterized protein n=1 Tax=Niabella drilacis (strain DSM 25811 / CCM 8410 / CCUG 62505 / LMG 26954 / E90) TaxID=1285928 RepID=A0A1G6I686_NIADE|nr:DUF5034 domain-containing protein [Niabella drilacis]SDC02014.1 protein of unknown function [Niabella drilacis]
MKSFIAKATLLFCVVTGLPGLFIACKKDADKGELIGGSTTYQYFKLKSLTAKNGDKSNTTGEAKTSIKKEDYIIRITNEVEMTSKPSATTAVASFFINAAHAENLVLVNIDTVKAVKIVTLKNFDQNLSAGSDVTNKFGIGGKTLQDWEILRILSVKPHSFLSVIPITLIGVPETEIKGAQFKVIYTLASGRQLEATTPEVDLL